MRYYSGLIVNITENMKSSFEVFDSAEIDSNLKKIRELPEAISKKILETPQFEIFFERGIPYYIANNCGTKTELPRKNGRGFYYDPVEDTPIFKLVINEVRKIAHREYEEEMLKQFGTKVVLGGVHIYYSIEASVLYREYGIRYVNNPKKFNHGLFID